MINGAAGAAKKRSPWRHVVVPFVVALILATLGQSVAAAAQNLKPRVAAQQAATEATIRTSHPGAPDLTRVSINPGPRLASAYSYDAYGTEGPFASGSNPQPYGFAGERTDGSGLQWLRARFYNPSAGSFMSRDAYLQGLDRVGTGGADSVILTDPRALNPYLYANGNPAVFIDPTGQMGDFSAAAQTVISSIQNVLRRINTSSQLFVARHTVAIVRIAQAIYGITTGDVVGATALGTSATVVAASGSAVGSSATASNMASSSSSLPTPSQAAQMVRNAEPVGSALLKEDAFHRAGTFAVDEIATNGHVFRHVGGDGTRQILVQVPGEMNGVAGRFEWILDSAGDLSHQFFVKGGSINGIPIQP